MPNKSGKSSAIETLKQNLKGKSKAVLEILDDLKKVKPEQWKSPSEIEKLAKNYANKLGLQVSEERIRQLANAYTDATKNGHTASADELIQKYGNNVDEKTAKEIKNFVTKLK
jgi:hypothetical protein